MSNWANEIKNVEGGKEKGRRSEVRDAMIAAPIITMLVLDQELLTYLGIWLACQSYLGKINNRYKYNYNSKRSGKRFSE